MKRTTFDYQRLDHKIYTHYANIEQSSGTITIDEKVFISKAYAWLASATNISKDRLKKLMNNRASWEMDEITKTCEALNIPPEFIPAYFFTLKDSKEYKINGVQDNIISFSFA